MYKYHRIPIKVEKGIGKVLKTGKTFCSNFLDKLFGSKQKTNTTVFLNTVVGPGGKLYG